MRDFIFHNPVKIYFGKGQARHIAQEVERVEGAVLVVYGGGSIKRNGAYDECADMGKGASARAKGSRSTRSVRTKSSARSPVSRARFAMA